MRENEYIKRPRLHVVDCFLLQQLPIPSTSDNHYFAASLRYTLASIMVKFTILLSLLSLALATAAKPQSFTSSAPVEVHYDKSAPEPVKRHTNAERLAEGLGPAMPRALGGLLPMRSRRERRVKNYRRQAPTVSATPPTCNNRPVSTAPVGQYQGDSDDSSFTINLPFQVQMYNTLTTTLYVSSNGVSRNLAA